jgi:lipid A disaccharide synthetase
MTSYKFSRPRFRERFARVFAVDEANRAQLLAWKTPPERITVVGNLAIDGAVRESQTGDTAADALATDAVVIMPGSRKHEIANMVPFFLRVAIRLREIDPSVPVVFGISPFTTPEELDRALEVGGLPTAYGARGRVDERNGVLYLVGENGGGEFPAVRSALRAASRARLALTIPGTKTIELAALGVPTLVAVPFNAPEAVVITGPLQYIERVPMIGVPVKRALALRFASRFTYYAQPNVDAGREVFPELVGTLTPGSVARRVHEQYGNREWRQAIASQSRSIYASHIGASQRMAEALAA